MFNQIIKLRLLNLPLLCASRRKIEAATSASFSSSEPYGASGCLMMGMIRTGDAGSAAFLAEQGAALKHKYADLERFVDDVIELKEIAPYVAYLHNSRIKDTFLIKEFKSAYGSHDLKQAGKLAQVCFPGFTKNLLRIKAIMRGARRKPIPPIFLKIAATTVILCVLPFVPFIKLMTIMTKSMKNAGETAEFRKKGKFLRLISSNQSI